jgi:hypothetical protein
MPNRVGFASETPPAASPRTLNSRTTTVSTTIHAGGVMPISTTPESRLGSDGCNLIFLDDTAAMIDSVIYQTQRLLRSIPTIDRVSRWIVATSTEPERT